MQIEKKQNHSTPSSSAATSSDSKVAQEYAATFPTRLALARWTRGGDIPHVHCFEHQLPMRAAWYEQAQHHFQAWLEAGGFHQTESGGPDGVLTTARPQTGTRVDLSRKSVPHRNPQSAPAPVDDETQRHSNAADMASPFPGVQSIPRDPGGDRQI